MGVLLFLLLITSANSYFVHSPSASVQPISSQQNNEIQNICGKVGGSKKTGLNKIDFGALARPGQFPWAAALEAKDENGTDARQCSATLISSRHALTAVHCILDREKCIECSLQMKTEKCDQYSNPDKTSDPSIWTLAYGGHCDTVGATKLDENCQEDNMKRVGVRAIAWDERYAEDCQNYDMAIIELEREIEFDYEYGLTLPICLADSNFEFKGAIATFFGFGVVAEDNDASRHSAYSQLRYGIALHFLTAVKREQMFLFNRLNETESERLHLPYLPRSQAAPGDSGGGVSTTGCDESTLLIGTISKSRFNDTESYASVLRTHIDEICAITGVCPINRC